MRWFWLFILGLIVLTGGLYANRVRATSRATMAPAVDPGAGSTPSRTRESRSDRERNRQSDAQSEPDQIQAEIQQPATDAIEAIESSQEEDSIAQHDLKQEIIEAVVSDEPAIDPAIELSNEPVPESIQGLGPESNVQTPSEPEPKSTLTSPDASETVVEGLPDPVEATAPASVLQSGEDPAVADIDPDTKPAPKPDLSPEPESSYEQLPDGSLKIAASGAVITGRGTQPDPFVVDWATLRSVERGYKPKAGKEELPGWLDVLDEKHVRIKGNTLVPVIATTTRELLVMQNPWDGCCIGIPPSPYDAIEVTLNHDVDFGNSAVGYGTVEGVFILDPYVVDGWVLGLYIIEDAIYRSGEGIAFPDF